MLFALTAGRSKICTGFEVLARTGCAAFQLFGEILNNYCFLFRELNLIVSNDTYDKKGSIHSLRCAKYLSGIQRPSGSHRKQEWFR